MRNYQFKKNIYSNLNFLSMRLKLAMEVCENACTCRRPHGATYVESSIHCLSEPDVFAVLALAGPPILARDAGGLRVDAGLSCLHVAEDLDCIDGAALIRINPVLTCRRKKGEKTQYISAPGIFTFFLPPLWMDKKL